MAAADVKMKRKWKQQFVVAPPRPPGMEKKNQIPQTNCVITTIFLSLAWIKPAFLAALSSSRAYLACHAKFSSVTLSSFRFNTSLFSCSFSDFWCATCFFSCSFCTAKTTVVAFSRWSSSCVATSAAWSSSALFFSFSSCSHDVVWLCDLNRSEFDFFPSGQTSRAGYR